MDYKAEFKQAKEAGDWNKVQELWKKLCQEAEIEEVSGGEAGRAKDIAELQNRHQAGDFQNGIKI